MTVTFNLSDFPMAILAPYGIEALSPDAFLCRLLEEDEEQVLVGVRRRRASLRRPAKTVEEYLSTLQANGLPQFVAFLRQWEEAM